MNAAAAPPVVIHLRDVRELAALLDRDEVDAAIERGLMQCAPCPRCVPAAVDALPLLAAIDAARARLHVAWAARERYRARTQRLDARRAARAAKRIAAALPQAPRPSLPPAAAAALARAKARAIKPSA